jgi:hypothetical protein
MKRFSSFFPARRDPVVKPRVCPVTGKVLEPRRRTGWLAWVFSGMGLVSLIWFLVRVLPKPVRATYPCQRVAFPVASGFVVWVAALLGSAFAWRKAQQRQMLLWRACLWGALAVAGGAVVLVNLPSFSAWAGNPAHGAIGKAKGIFPGRVAWVHAPEAVKWDGYSSTEHWFETNHTDLAVVEQMVSEAVRTVGGGGSDASAWEAMFRYFNQAHGRGLRGYQAGEKIAIKLNLTTCNARSGSSTVDLRGTYEKQDGYSDRKWLNTIDNSPQMLLSLLRQLVYNAGVPQDRIYMGDPTGNFPRYLWDRLHPEFPEVHYFDNYGGAGRMRVEFSKVPFNWSVVLAKAGEPVVQDYVPVPFAEADYLINFAVLKGHSVGVTLCAKNLYGALLRCPDGYSRDATAADHKGNYSNMHSSTPDPGMPGTPGLGHYRCLVDLMGSPALGDKTMLYLVDGLFGGYFWDSHPRKWNSAPFNGNWPASLFASQDPVAIDSVCYDFLLAEWPNIVNNGKETAGTALQGGAEDYLHEAALADHPPSGTVYDPGQRGGPLPSLGVHEHWNNTADKQYSRNLDPVNGQGIELVRLSATRPPATVEIARGADGVTLSWRSSLLGYRLQHATNLSTAPEWTDVSSPPARREWWNTVTNAPDAGSQFYRLRR